MQRKNMELLWKAALIAAGFIGAAGVAAAAAASHAGQSRNLTAIAAICLAHGPALAAIGLSRVRTIPLGLAAALLILGTVVFTSDLGTREWTGHGLFPGAAPLGGVGMIGGWLCLGAAGFRLRES